MSRHSTTRRLRNLATTAGVSLARMHPHMLPHTYVPTTLDAGVDLAPSKSQPATPTPARP